MDKTERLTLSCIVHVTEGSTEQKNSKSRLYISLLDHTELYREISEILHTPLKTDISTTTKNKDIEDVLNAMNNLDLVK